MQAITALAHLKSAVLYFTDVSEQCGYTLPQQVWKSSFPSKKPSIVEHFAWIASSTLFLLQFELFESIRPLFQRKPLVVVANKCDVKRLDELSDENKVKQFVKKTSMWRHMRVCYRVGICYFRSYMKRWRRMTSPSLKCRLWLRKESWMSRCM